MDEQLKKLTQELGQAIDEAINESPHVKELTEKLRQAGYETMLMVEATICFARRQQTLGGNDAKSKEAEKLVEMMSNDDLQFLRSLKISIDNADSENK